MLSPLSETNRYVLPTNTTTGQGTSFDAHAPAGYQGSTEGLAAGQRVQTGARTQTSAEQLPERTRHVARKPGRAGESEGASRPQTERRSLAPYAPDVEGRAAGLERDLGAARQHREGDPSEEPEASQDEEIDGAMDSRELQRLRQRDAEVRAHEQAHAAAGGSYAGRPTYEYERGPDGRQYAVAGEVQIDTAPVSDDPEATIQKMRTVRRAALAPAEPSPQDRRVAAEASRKEANAREDLAEQRHEERVEALAEEKETPPVEAVEEREEAEPAASVRAQDVGRSQNGIIANDFTAADVGPGTPEPLLSAGAEDKREMPGAAAADVVSRARSGLAFSA